MRISDGNYILCFCVLYEFINGSNARRRRARKCWSFLKLNCSNQGSISKNCAAGEIFYKYNNLKSSHFITGSFIRELIGNILARNLNKSQIRLFSQKNQKEAKERQSQKGGKEAAN